MGTLIYAWHVKGDLESLTGKAHLPMKPLLTCKAGTRDSKFRNYKIYIYNKEDKAVYCV